MPIERLPRSLINQMLRQAQQSSDREVCGLIGSRNGIPARCYPVANVSGEPARLFEMDAKGQIEAMRRMREYGEELFGIYHSHPFTPAIPSPIDIAADTYPEALYLIISLGTAGVLELRGFRLQNGRFQPVELELAEFLELDSGSASAQAG